MKRFFSYFQHVRTVAVLSLLLLMGQPIQAYELTGASWAGTWPVVGYHINAASFPTAAGSQQEIIDAIRKGANHWNFEASSQITLVYLGTTTISSASDDDTNVIFYDANECDSPAGDCIGETNWWPATGSLTDFDITFNGEDSNGDPVDWDATDPVLFANDLWGVAVHEFGHALGLAHEDVASWLTMNMDLYELGDTYLRFLESDDVDGTQYLYSSHVGISKSANGPNSKKIHVDFADSNGLTYEFMASDDGTSPGIDMSSTDAVDTRVLTLNTPLIDMSGQPSKYANYTGTLDSQGKATMTWTPGGSGRTCLDFAVKVIETSANWPNNIRHISPSKRICAGKIGQP